MKVAENGLCKLSDKYFEDFSNPRHVFNKQEKRPYFYAIRKENGIVWLVPLSSQVEKYQSKIQEDANKHRECIYYYIAKVKGNESAFLIGNAIPVTDKYIVGPFTVNDIPFVIKNKNDIKQIKSRLNKYLALVKRGKLSPAVDILSIEKSLLNNKDPLR